MAGWLRGNLRHGQGRLAGNSSEFIMAARKDLDCTDIIQIEVLCVSDMVGAMNATNGTNETEFGDS